MSPLLHRGGRNTTAPRDAVFAQRAMVVFQMGLAVFVLFVAGLLGRTLQTLYAIDTGLAVDDVAVVELSLPDRKFASGERVAAMYESLLPRIKALPGVTSVATVNVVPFTGATSGWDGAFVAEGQSSPAPVFNVQFRGGWGRVLRDDGHKPAQRPDVRQERPKRQRSGRDGE